MRRLLFLLLIILPSLAHAQETIVSYDNNSLPILNEELRQSSASLRNIKAQVADLLPIDLSLYGTETTGISPIAAGGTGQDTAQEAIDSLMDASSGDAGQVWTTDGTNGAWGDVDNGFNLVSTTTFSRTDCESGCRKNISIDDTKNYLLTWVARGWNDGGNPPGVRLSYILFNNDTGSKYYYVSTDRYGVGTQQKTTTDTEGRAIGVQGDSGGASYGRIYISFNKVIKAENWITASISGVSQVVSPSGASPFSGISGWRAYEHDGIFVSGSTAISTIDLYFVNGATETTSGTIWLYELTQ